MITGPHRVKGYASVAADGVSARVALPAGYLTVLLVSDVALHWEAGDNTVTASTSTKFLPAATPVYFEVPRGSTHIAALEAVADTEGTLAIYAIG